MSKLASTPEQWEAVVKKFCSSNLSEHPPGLYRFDRVVDHRIDGFGAFNDAAIKHFADEGYLIIDNAFTGAEVQNALDGLMHLILGGNPEFKDVQFEAKAQERLHEYSDQQKQDAVRKLMYFTEFDARLKAMSNHPRLIEVLTTLCGDAPVMFQDMALLKPPFIGREKPWHQDLAYFDIPTDTKVVGAWVALDEATPDNGCMHIIPRSHKRGPQLHFPRRDWQICDSEVDVLHDTMVPLKPGGILLFSGLMHHGTPINHSDKRRRAVQFHYKPASCVATSTEERLKAFGADGKGVEC